jgi:3-dehydroquinate synthase
MKPKSFSVLGCRVIVGFDLNAEVMRVARALKPSRFVIMCDDSSHLLSGVVELRKNLSAVAPTSMMFFKVSERTKDVDRILPLYTRLIEAGVDRKSVIFAVGGGVIGDMAGFVAATYQRGIRWVNVPTTLLAQVDSSVGGKTGVNLPLGKNLVGAFHQPSEVICNVQWLRTLQPRDIISGLGEMIKYGLSLDAPYYDYLKKNRQKILERESSALLKSVHHCLKLKAKIVEVDEKEEKGKRVVLNFGHTVAHALEGFTNYRRYRHGEAVVWGMRVAIALSVERGYLAYSAYREIDSFLGSLKVPALPRGVRLSNLSPYLKRDKKNESGRLTFVLLRGIGKWVLDGNVDDKALKNAWEMICYEK